MRISAIKASSGEKVEKSIGTDITFSRKSNQAAVNAIQITQQLINGNKTNYKKTDSYSRKLEFSTAINFQK